MYEESIIDGKSPSDRVGSYNNSTSLENNSATSINDNSNSSPRQQVDKGIVINHQEENYITSGDTPSWVQPQISCRGQVTCLCHQPYLLRDRQVNST